MIYYVWGILVMAAVTYLPRALPLSLLRHTVKSRFLRSWLYYMPYAVLGAMTIPAILYSTSSVWSAAVGLAAALALSYIGLSLLPVALISALSVFLTEWLMHIDF
ncbi:MAG: AzlD domain-containing protein [Clostridia bacterium]|nr:AzlD domain-containing protein [Clostridia bacterium]